MPKNGYRSITVNETIFDNFQQTYNKVESELKTKGVTSFSGYITYLLEEAIHTDKIFTKYKQKIECLSIEPERIILKDNRINRIAEVTITNSIPKCCLCDKKDCSHIGFCYSLYQIYSKLGRSN